MARTAAHIIVVDDDPSLLGFTFKYLSRLGYSVATCLNAEDAWRKFERRTPDYSLALVDISMPGLSGEELSRKMLAASPELRLIVTSGYPFCVERLEEAGSGRVAFLHKPFTPRMLVETIGELLGGR